jgi:hypothetical protein
MEGDSQMDVNEMFPGRYIKAETLNGKARTYHVVAVERVKLSDGSLKPVITFEDEDMKFILNRTNADSIVQIYGRDSDNWIGKLIELYPTRTQFGTKMVDAVRVRRPQRRPASDRVPPEPMPRDNPVGGAGDYDGPEGADELVYEAE